MDSRRDSQEVGKHLLGAHVVGQRIVVRRLLRGEAGPTGGPAFGDTLGVCTAWGDGRCLVQTAGGGQVSIPIADIVSGKPVPPRPSVRHRVSAREAEGHALALWPDVERAPLGDWELRSDPETEGRLRKRANSCLAIGDPHTSYAEAIGSVHAFYDRRSRRPLAQVELGSAADDAFREAGWTVIEGGDSHFQLTSLAQLSRMLRPNSRDSFETLLADGDAGSVAPLPPGPVSAELVGDGPRVVVEVRCGSETIARARAGRSRDWLGVHGFSVDPAYRRRGLARRMMAELVEWGAEQGLSTVWVHTEVDNAPALALYEGLGFRTHHSLRYLSPAAPGVTPS